MRQGRRARENRWVKKSALEETPKDPHEGMNTGRALSGNTAVALHSQDGTKLPPVMLDASTFGDYENSTLFCITLKDKKHKFFFVMKPEFITNDFPSRDAKMSFGNKFLAEQEIPVWQKLADADWQILDDEQKKSLVADQVTILFKNQYFSMRDMHEAQAKLDGEFITVNRDTYMRVAGLDFKIYKILLKDGSKINAALFSSTTTKLLFASQSAKLTLLVEVSKETFTLSSKKNIKLEDYFMFLKNYLEILDNELCSHDLTVLLYAKVFFPCFENINDLYLAYARSKNDCGELASYQVDKRGRIYKDYIQRVPIPKYLTSERVLGMVRKAFFDFVDNLPMDQQNYIFQTLVTTETDGQRPSTLSKLKSREDVYSEKDIGLSKRASKQVNTVTGELSNSSESCILEAMAMVLSSLSIQNDHKCLKSSGYLIVIITPGDGLYHSEEYFFKYVELKALTMDATISLICFEKNIYGNRPTFISVDDEKVIEVLLDVTQWFTLRFIRTPAK